MIREGNAISVEELKKQKELLVALKEKDAKLKGQLRDMLDIAPFAISGKLFADLMEQVIAEKKAKRLLKRLDHEHASYYNFYSRKRWGHANNYDLCINTASYGIDGTVEFIYKMINRK